MVTCPRVSIYSARSPAIFIQTPGRAVELAMGVRADSMLEYWTRDHETPIGAAPTRPWFPPLSSSMRPVNLQLMAISQHDFCRAEQTPVTMNLHVVTEEGTRVEYLVRLLAMTIVEDWTPGSGTALSPEILHESDGHESLEGFTRACFRNHVVVNGHQPGRTWDRENRRRPATMLWAHPEPRFTMTEQGGVWYQTPPDVLDETAMLCSEVSYRPTRHSNLVVNSWGPDSLVATYFMSNGVPVSYNLAIVGAYIQQRHRADYDEEVRRLLTRFTRNVSR